MYKEKICKALFKKIIRIFLKNTFYTVKIREKPPSNIIPLEYNPLKIATNFRITPLKVKCLEWPKNAFYTGRKCFLMKIKFSK